MSAYVVNKAHIDFLVTAALRISRYGFSWHVPGSGDGVRKMSEAEASAVGLMLWTANYESVGYRYSDSATLPGKIGTTRDVPAYSHAWADFRPERDALRVCQALDGYEYQSCEHPGWSGSEAEAFCIALRKAATKAIPGADDVDGWHITDTPAPAAKRIRVYTLSLTAVFGRNRKAKFTTAKLMECEDSATLDPASVEATLRKLVEGQFRTLRVRGAVTLRVSSNVEEQRADGIRIIPLSTGTEIYRESLMVAGFKPAATPADDMRADYEGEARMARVEK